MSKMINVASGFQYSVNIGYDLNSEDKLKNFIPTKSSLNLLDDILRSTRSTSTDRARVLVGAYGKGKSHIMLMILSILMKKDLSLFEKMLPKVKENPELYQLIENYYDSDNKILPVVITGNSSSLTQSFLLALERTLSDNDLLNSMPETNYHAAVTTIQRWEKDFPKTFKKFQQMIDVPTDKFIDNLENFDASAYGIFEQAYPALTSGSVFNPFLGFDVVDLYESVAKSLKDSGYSGIYVVYDEFSKYLEANITQASVSDTKMLQDFAEKCNRSGSLQMHIMLISHKEISNYIDKLPQQKVDGWRGVSDRFKHIHLNNNFTQTYEIISNVIQKDERTWKSFCKDHDRDFDELYKRYRSHPMFQDASDEFDTAIKGCYPLHPVSIFILPRLSERVAQNERTLFTFLSAEGTSTLPDFLARYDEASFQLVTPDRIYDYFEPLFKKEVYSGDIHEYYFMTSTILDQIPEDSLQSKIVKTISLIYILGQFERLKPTVEELVGIYSFAYSVDDIRAAIDDLVEKEFVLYIRRSNGYLRLKQSSGVDIQQKINDLVLSNRGKASIKDTLNKSNFDNYMYPYRYNNDHEMIRYFSFEFIEGKEVTPDIDWEIKSEDIDADGVIYGIIPSNEEQIKDIEKNIKTSSIDQNRFIFVIPKHYKDIAPIIQEYRAVTTLRDMAENDPILFDEYEVIFEDLHEIIMSFINSYTHPEEYASIYIHNGEVLTFRRKASFTKLMSDICDEVFYLTPVINNESVNRNEITGVASTSRNKIISGLLRAELEHNLGLTGTGQDVSIMRSTLLRTGVLKDDENFTIINMHPGDERMENVLSTIERFIIGARENGKSSFGLLYHELISPEGHIGLRKGLIPIYLAAVMHQYLKQIIVSNSISQMSINADTLMLINNDPHSYSLEYLDWNPEKEEYIKRLTDTFEEYIVPAEKSGNSYDYVANAMHRWYMALPKYAKECKKPLDNQIITGRQKEMLKALRVTMSSSDLLFKKLPEAFDYNDSFSVDLAQDIALAKNAYDGLLDALKKHLISEMKDIFALNANENLCKKMSLTSVMKEWSDSLDKTVFEQLFTDGTERFLTMIKDATNDEETFVTRAAKLATDLRIEDWDDKTSNIFIKNIKTYKKTAEDFHNNAVAETINDTNAYQITFSDENGNSTTKRFDKTEVSSRGKLLFNQITASLDAMGHSIPDAEKRQILMEVLKKMC